MKLWEQLSRKRKWIVGISVTAIVVYGPMAYNSYYTHHLVKTCTPVWNTIVNEYASLQKASTGGEFYNRATEFFGASTEEAGSFGCINGGHNMRFPEELQKLNQFNAQVEFWYKQYYNRENISPPELPWRKIEYMVPLCYGPSILHLQFYSKCLIGYGWNTSG